MDTNSLEKSRKTCLGLYLAGLLITAAGVFAVRSSTVAGVAAIILGWACWLTGSLWAKPRYQNACAEALTKRGLGMPDAQFFDKKEAPSLNFPAKALVPGGRVSDPPLFLHTAQGTLRGRKAEITELTQAHHDEGSTKRKYLVGSLIRLPAPAARKGLLALCGHPYGGSMRTEDFSPLTLLETPGRAFHVLAGSDAALTEGQAAALDVFCANGQRNAVFLTQNGSVCAFLPMRFYSGHFDTRTPATDALLDEDPLPELDDALKVLDALAKPTVPEG